MTLKLSKTNTAPYDYYSEGSGLTPITTQAILDNTGGIVGSDAIVEKTIESKPEVSLKVNLVAENTINEKSGKKQFSRNSIQDEYL